MNGRSSAAWRIIITPGGGAATDGTATAPDAALDVAAPGAPPPGCDDDDKSGGQLLPSAASLLAGPARPPTETFALPSAASLLQGPARPPREDAWRPAKKQRVAPGSAAAVQARKPRPSGPAMLVPPQMRRPNLSTEAVSTWSSKATADRFARSQLKKKPA